MEDNTQKIKDINKAIWKAINKTINKFREHPYYFFTESDIHSYFYYASYSSKHTAPTKDGKPMYCVHREYPTNFRYNKKDLLDSQISKPCDLEGTLGSRGHYDIAVLDPDFINKVDSEKDIINKDVRLVIKRAEKNKNIQEYKELLFAIEFKYVINNSEKFVKEVKMDNKKLLFALEEFGGAARAANLVFCNVSSAKYIGRIIKEVQDADQKILSIFIRSYYGKDGKIAQDPIIMNRNESEINYGITESL